MTTASQVEAAKYSYITDALYKKDETEVEEEIRRQTLRFESMTIGNPTMEQILKCEKLMKKEEGHWQFDKLAINWGAMVLLVVISLLRGSAATPSIAGIE